MVIQFKNITQNQWMQIPFLSLVCYLRCHSKILLQTVLTIKLQKSQQTDTVCVYGQQQYSVYYVILQGVNIHFHTGILCFRLGSDHTTNHINGTCGGKGSPANHQRLAADIAERGWMELHWGRHLQSVYVRKMGWMCCKDGKSSNATEPWFISPGETHCRTVLLN